MAPINPIRLPKKGTAPQMTNANTPQPTVLPIHVAQWVLVLP